MTIVVVLLNIHYSMYIVEMKKSITKQSTKNLFIVRGVAKRLNLYRANWINKRKILNGRVDHNDTQET